MADVPWGDFPDHIIPATVTAADMRAAAAYFANTVTTEGALPAIAAVLAADRATIQARDAERIRGVFAAPDLSDDLRHSAL